MSTFEKNDKNQAVLTIEIAGADFEKAIDAAYKKTAGKYVIAGFRRGKAPRKLIEKYYGEGIFFEDAFDEAYGNYYIQALDEHKLTPVDYPHIEIKDIKDDKTVVFTATVDLKPEVKLGAYKGIKAEKKEYTVSDEEVEHELSHALDKASRMVEITDRPVKNGDTVQLDYSGSVDGVKFAGGTAENQTLVIGSGSFIPGFEEQMIGMNVGEAKNLNVKFPDEYHSEDLKGKDAVFAVKVLGIKEKQVPALDDEFAKDVSEFDTLEEYKADIRKNLQKDKDSRADSEYEMALVDAVCDNAEVDIPGSMVERQIDYQIRDIESRMKYQGISMDDYLKYTGTTKEQMRESYRDGAKRTVLQQLVLEAVKNAEGITADEESVNKEIGRYAEMMGKTLEEYKATLKPEELEYFNDTVTIANTIKFLKDNNTAVAAKAEKKPAAKKAPAKKAEGEAAEKKPAAKKAPAKKAEGEAAEKKPAAKKAPAKKAEGEAAEKKPATKKAPAKKAEGEVAEKKPAAKKTTKKTEG